MKKRASSTHFLMWVMVIWLHAHLSIAAVSKSNDTTNSVCDGSVEDCLNVDHLDSQLPTISSSQFHRMLAGGGNTGKITFPTGDPNHPALCKALNGNYIKCGASADPGTDSKCAQAPYNKGCSNVNPPNR